MKPPLPLRGVSLRTRFVLTSLIVIAVAFGPAVTLLSQRMHDIGRRWFERSALSVTVALGPGVSAALDRRDGRGVEAALRALDGATDVVAATVRDRGGAVLGAYGRGASGAQPAPPDLPLPTAGPRLSWGDGGLRVDAPLAGGGALTVVFGRDDLEREQRRNWLIILSIAGAASLLLMLLEFVFGTSLVRSIRRITELTLRVAEGDLSQGAQVDRSDEVGQMSAAIGRMIEGQREVVRQIGETSVQLAAAATELYGAAQDQEAAATEQSAGMEEVRRTMMTLLDSASHIAESARGVLENAERSKDTADATSSRITELSRHTSRIAEILEVIRDIADRSDLLALNASLEATRAGEAGRAFQLVAGEMRRLAERVTASVQDIKSLVADVRASGASTVMANDEGRKLTDSTTESARQITVVTQQQRTGTEQVSEGLVHMTNLVNQSLAATQHTRVSAAMLKDHAEQLAAVVSRFHLEAASGAGAGSADSVGAGGPP